MSRVTHFDMTADDPDRAIGFYEKVFGWKFLKWDGPMDYWMIDSGDGEGIDGGMGLRDERMPSVYCTITIDDMDRYLELVAKAGGAVSSPKMAIPGVGWFATIRDTEGNIFGLMQNDVDAR